MPTILQLRRGTTSQHSSFTGAEGEVTVDTTKDTLVVHDGSTAGGYEVALADGSNFSSEKIQDVAAALITGASHTNITATYDDSAGTLALAASSYSDADVGTYLTDNGYATQATIVAAISDSAPGTLDTLNELAAALGDDANFATTTATSLSNRLRIDVNNQGLDSTETQNALTNLGLTATSTELNYMDGVTSAVQTQLDDKADKDELPSQVTATASGAIVNGDPVILNSDGTVTSVAETGTSRGRLSSEVMPGNLGSSNDLAVLSYDVAANKILSIYKNNFGHMYGQVGTLESDNTVTFATAVRLGSHSMSSSLRPVIVYDPVEEDHVIFFHDNSSDPHMMVLTISGNTVTAGTIQDNNTFENALTGASYDSRSSCIVAVGLRVTLDWARGALYSRTGANTLELAGTFVIDDTYPAGTIGTDRFDMDITPLDDAGRFLFHGNIRDGGSSNNPRAAVISVNSAGDDATVGNFLELEGATAGDTTLSSSLNGNITFEQIGTDKVAFMFMTGTSSGQLAIASVSGDTITFGQPISLISSTLYSGTAPDLFWSTSQSLLVITYADTGNSYYGTMQTATVSGTTITLSSQTAVTIHEGNPSTSGSGSVFIQSNGKLISNFSNDLYVTQTYDLSATNLTNTNYLGIASADVADGASAVIQTAGSIDDAQSGLVVGSRYFVQGDGTLATTVDSSYPDIKVFAGTAMSTTDLRVAKSDAVLQDRIGVVETDTATNTGNIANNASAITANRIDIYNASGTLLN